MGLEIKTASGKKSKKEKADRLTIQSPKVKATVAGKKKPVDVPLVDLMIQLNQQIENLSGEMKAHRKTLIETTSEKRQESLDAKSFVKTVDVAGTVAKIQVQFRDAYSSLSDEMEKPLRDIFNSNFETLFGVNTTQTLRAGKIAELKELLGDRFDAFFDTVTTVHPVKDFQERYFTLEGSLNDEQKETVQKVFDACQSSPSVKFPK